MLAALNHPHIAAIYGIEDDEGIHALVLELVDGETLAERIARGPLPVAHALEEQTGKFFHFEGSEGLPLDHFAVTMEGSRDEIEQHAVPFRAGEEVHVHIVEPHMYNPDDGVAKVDGYLISVTNGIAFVGEKKLVRIAASASAIQVESFATW